jgi:hypothetical protein
MRFSSGIPTANTVNVMKKRDAILGGIALAIILTIVSCSLIILASGVTIKSDDELTIATGFLVIATLILAGVAEMQRRSSEKMTRFQTGEASRLSDKQTYSLKWMEQQKTRPYCDFVIILNTATPKPIGVYLKNFGHGPGLRLKWKFTYKGEAIPETGREGLRNIASRYSLHNWLEGYVPNVIAASTEEGIFRLRDADSRNSDAVLAAREKAAKELTDMINNMNIELVFESIMGQEETIRLHDTKEKLVS